MSCYRVWGGGLPPKSILEVDKRYDEENDVSAKNSMASHDKGEHEDVEEEVEEQDGEAE